MKWKKLGKIFDVDDIKLDSIVSHVSVPFIDSIENGIAKIFFSSRDKENRSNTLWFRYDLEKLKIREIDKYGNFNKR